MIKRLVNAGIISCTPSICCAFKRCTKAVILALISGEISCPNSISRAESPAVLIFTSSIFSHNSFRSVWQTPNVIGKISPFKAPASTSNTAGCPASAIQIVLTAINPTINHFSFFSIVLLNVLRKDTDVYAHPTIDVIAAHKITSPKKRYPICPAPCKNASAVGFAGSSV